MAMQRSAAVIGGSLGGLFAANLLLRAGWDVHVYERAAEELEGRGAGIVTHPELFDVLRDAGVVVDDSLGVKVTQRVTLDHSGHRLAECELPQTLTAWSRLYSALRTALPDSRYHTGKQLVAFSDDGAAVHARFSDGQAVRADLLVAADGIRSTIRQHLLPQVKPMYAGYLAWRGLVEESALSAQALRDVFPYFAFGLPAQEQMIAYPVAGANNAVAPGRRRYNFVWYRPASQAQLTDMLTDGDGKVWPEGIPPPLIRTEVLDGARQAARAVLAPQFAEVVEKTGALLFQPIYDLESPQLAFGRIALIGDAAFVARPHCGMGVTKAAADAAALADALASPGDDIAAGLRRFESQRLAFGARVVGHARELGAYLEATAQGRDNSAQAHDRSPKNVMLRTAVPMT